MQSADSLEKTLMLGEIEGRRRRGRQRMRWLDGITDFSGHESEHAPGVGDGQGGLVCCSPCVCVCSKSHVSSFFWISGYGVDIKVILEPPSQLVVSWSDTKVLYWIFSGGKAGHIMKD